MNILLFEEIEKIFQSDKRYPEAALEDSNKKSIKSFLKM